MRSFTYMLCSVIALGLCVAALLSGGLVQSAGAQEVTVKEIDLNIEELEYYYKTLGKEYRTLYVFVNKQITADVSYAEVGTMLTGANATQRQTDLRADIIVRRQNMTTPQKVRDHFENPEGSGE